MSLAPLTSLLLDVLGVPMRLEFAGDGAEAIAGRTAEAWERCRTQVEAGADAEVRTVRVVLDSDQRVVEAEVAAGAVAGQTERVVLDALTARLVQDGLEAVVGDRLLLHACALADPETGATAVLVAPSGTGKTTASSVLASAFGYVTDETAAIERDGSMRPFPKPLSQLVDGLRPKRQVSPSSLGMLPAPPAPWAAKIAYLARDPECQGVRIERVPTIEALALLAEQTSSLNLLVHPLRTLAQMLEQRGGLQRLVYAEASDLLPVVSQWLSEAERPTAADGVGVGSQEPFLPSLSSVASEEFIGAHLDGPRLHRRPVTDELVGEEGMAVMLPGQVLALSALATVILLAVGEAGETGLPLSSLEKYIEGEVPPPSGVSVADALAPLLRDLVDRDLLEHR